MNESYIRNVLEAAMLAAGKSLTLAEMGQLFDEGARPKVEDIRAALDALAAEYANRGIEVKETAAGFRIQVRRELAGEVSRLWPERPARYSRALLETLALIAYRQPITRAEIEAVRGVAVNPNIIKTVIERNWVRVVGHRDVPGRPELLGTTREFLDYFGLRSLDELPPLAELKAVGEYNLQLELPNAGELGVEGKAADGAAADGTADEGTANESAGAHEAAIDGTAVDGIAVDEAAVDGAAVDGAAVPVAATAVPVAALAHEGAEGSAGDADVDAVVAGDAVAAAAAVLADGAVSDASDHDAAGEGLVGHGDGGEAGSGEAPSGETAVVEAALVEIDEDEVVVEAVASLDVLEVVSEETTDSDESDLTEVTVIASDAVDSIEDGTEEEADEDELSADGQGTRELVAGPRDRDE